MKIIIDKHAGFCGGVKKTIKIAENELETNNNVLSLCELIHNPQEIERLEKNGLKIIDHKDIDEDLKEKFKDSVLITRAHGEKWKYFEQAKKMGFNIIDGTCSIVARLQKKIENAYREGYQIIIVGKKHHPEVIGLLDRTEGTARVILNVDEIGDIDFSKKSALFAQTTISEELFDSISDELLEKFNKLDINKTICKAVLNRKVKIKEFLKQVNTLLFVGGKNSSNTKALVEYCKTLKSETYHIESEGDIDLNWLDGSNYIGITGSASTPKWLMERIRQYLINKLTINH
ncbi:4-hydroxy-3-methylbut-2-enyl diphosphate reductase [candidate division KSB1 bacterium]